MSWHDPLTTLRQMKGFAEEARSLVAGRSAEAIVGDRILNLALARLLELIGESATRIEDDVRGRHRNIPWREMIALRNRLIHGYDVINAEILLRIVLDDLQSLINDLQQIIDRGVT